MAHPIRVTIWNEHRHERSHAEVQRLYPQGIHAAIGDALRQHMGDSATIRYATLDDPEHGLTESVLRETDVLTWWGHMAHAEVSDAVAERVQQAVLRGMGLVV